MSLFDQLVDEALQNRRELNSLRVVVEKELLHHDILRVLSESGLLSRLTFIGGTCLRACYGSNRLSEDLDFTGGTDFKRDRLITMAESLVTNMMTKYGLEIQVSEPTRESGNVDTWKLKVQTRPDRKDLPAQRINIDVCAIPSYQPHPMLLLNPYGVEMGTSGLILQVESREEIFTDKLCAFALRPNRIKNRDLWDIVWLHGQGLSPRLSLIPYKLKDRNHTKDYFLNLFEQRIQILKESPKTSTEFKQEMYRFLPIEQVNKILGQESFWDFLTFLMEDLGNQIRVNID